MHKLVNTVLLKIRKFERLLKQTDGYKYEYEYEYGYEYEHGYKNRLYVSL